MQFNNKNINSDENLHEMQHEKISNLQTSPEKKFLKSNINVNTTSIKSDLIVPFNEKLLSHFIFAPNPDFNQLRKHVESLHADLIYATKGLKNSTSDLGAKQVALIDRKSLDFDYFSTLLNF